MKITVAISPCPNDTFMFDAMLNGRIDTEGLEFEYSMADIEELNAGVTGGGGPMVSKASYAIVPAVTGKYRLLSSGSALGNGNGPLFVAADEDADVADFDMRIAIPGRLTTANLLMERLYPHLSDKEPVLFSDIIAKVEKGEYDAGVLIHEGRFVYRHYGLYLLADLGLEWERRTGLPLPLGAILVSRELPEEVQRRINSVLRRSIEYARANPEASAEFVRSHAQEMDPEVIKSHIGLFVNDYSVDLGDKGRRAVRELLGIDDEGVYVM